jgi:hypothetical protein
MLYNLWQKSGKQCSSVWGHQWKWYKVAYIFIHIIIPPPPTTTTIYDIKLPLFKWFVNLYISYWQFQWDMGWFVTWIFLIHFQLNFKLTSSIWIRAFLLYTNAPKTLSIFYGMLIAHPVLTTDTTHRESLHLLCSSISQFLQRCYVVCWVVQ